MINWVALFEEVGFTDYYPLNGRRSKRVRSGWLQLQCNSCGSSGDLLGIPENGNGGTCYFCGSQAPSKIIKDLLDCSWAKAYELVDKHKVSAIYEVSKNKKEIRARNKSLDLPPHTNIKKTCGNYLRSRGYDVKKLIDEYSIVQGKKNSKWDGYVIFPIFYKGKMVSFIGRDFTGRKKNKYKVCETKDELIDHKQILCGIDDIEGDDVFVVEGIFDKAKMPKGKCVATLGIKFSQSQLNELKKFKRVFILFDGETKAIKQSRLLANGLSLNGVEAYSLQLGEDKDPGDLSYEDCEKLIKEVG